MVRVPAGMRRPTLVLSTDGVGTKVLVALQAGRFDTVGEDLVNHSVNDILVHGAPGRSRSWTTSRAPASAWSRSPAWSRGSRAGAGRTAWRSPAARRRRCRASTSRAPTTWRAPSSASWRRTRRCTATPSSRATCCWRYASTGLHTNGYTLARRIVFERMGLGLDDPLGDTGQTVADALLAVHRSYAASVLPVLGRMHGLAHITGGGIPGNLVRDAARGMRGGGGLRRRWELPPLFATLQQAGGISTDEMREVFNLGVGLIAVLPAGRRGRGAGRRRAGRRRDLGDGRDSPGRRRRAVRPA